MTAIEKVLLRKDVSSLIVAITLSTSLGYLLISLVGPLASRISLSDQFQPQGGPSSWDIALQSVVSFALTLVALELLLRIVILVRSFVYKKAK